MFWNQFGNFIDLDSHHWIFMYNTEKQNKIVLRYVLSDHTPKTSNQSFLVVMYCAALNGRSPRPSTSSCIGPLVGRRHGSAICPSSSTLTGASWASGTTTCTSAACGAATSTPRLSSTLCPWSEAASWTKSTRSRQGWKIHVFSSKLGSEFISKYI